MEKPLLNDKDLYPSEELIHSIIGKTDTLWDSFFNLIEKEYPDFSKEWRFYNDGKTWLMKVVNKKKTVCWVSILKGAFRTTFYFTDKAEEDIFRSGISDDLIEQFKNGKHYGKIRGLTIKVTRKKDIEYIFSLIPIRLSY